MKVSSLFPRSPAWRGYLNLDNAATTPAASVVQDAVKAFLKSYGSVARGAGKKSVLSTALVEAARRRVLSFFGASDDYVLIAGFNTTSAINRCLALMRVDSSHTVLVSEAEHSSNALPWTRACVKSLPSDDDGNFSIEFLADALDSGVQVDFVACPGASNASGQITDYRTVCRLAHARGAKVFLDAAQLVAHRKIDLGAMPEEERPDFIAFAGHKMYAPFGFGAVLARVETIPRGAPDMPGGGTVILYGPEAICWEENVARRIGPGTPNAVGLIAISAAMEMLDKIGFDFIVDHDQKLLKQGRKCLGTLDEIVFYNPKSDPGVDAIPIFVFNHRQIDHALCASRLSWEHNIAVRSGHLCQFAYMRRHLDGAADAECEIVERARHGDYEPMYGMVRASCGLQTSLADLDHLAGALDSLSAPTVHSRYNLGVETGVPRPQHASEVLATLVDARLEYLKPYLRW